MARLHYHILLLDDVADIGWEIVMLECLSILGDGDVFAPLALDEDAVFFTISQGGLKVHPTATKRGAECAFGFHILAEIAHESLQFAGKLLTLHREFAEERLEVDVLYILKSGTKAFLPILAGFDE